MAGTETCALLDDKSVKCFGYNGEGQLGVGDTTQRNTPTAVTALGTSVAQIDLACAHMLCVCVCVRVCMRVCMRACVCACVRACAR